MDLHKGSIHCRRWSDYLSDSANTVSAINTGRVTHYMLRPLTTWSLSMVLCYVFIGYIHSNTVQHHHLNLCCLVIILVLCAACATGDDIINILMI